VNDIKRIEPRTLKGFRDYLPETMIPREWLIDTARRVYRSYGFSPIDTPALSSQTFAGEETDKQLYKFCDRDKRWVGLRFDLTVPLARFVAQHLAELPLPFKRYHVAAVWRGENTQRGRYREFMQCDYDTIGTAGCRRRETPGGYDLSPRSVGTVHDPPQQPYTVHGRIGLRGNRRRSSAGRFQDRAVGWPRDLHRRATPQRPVLRLAAFRAPLTKCSANWSRLAGSTGRRGSPGRGARGVRAAGADTGPPDLRSPAGWTLHRHDPRDVPGCFAGDRQVCSSGGMTTWPVCSPSRSCPIGPLGLDRSWRDGKPDDRETGHARPRVHPYFDQGRLHDYLRLAAALRAAGIGVEVFPEPKKLGQQLKYADRRGFRVALIAGENEFTAGTCRIKDLQRATQQDVPLEADAASVIAAVLDLLAK
jgi:histidyl-tRNA synthetase